jgi:hypothetical protein
MKFVYNEEKNQEMRNILMMQPTVEEAQAALDKDETDPYAWYLMGTALGLGGKMEEAIDAYSIGISYAPFYAPNYFGRGRKHNGVGEWRQAIADFSLCIQLDSQNWTYWYYRATTENIHEDYENCIDDFKECLKLTNPDEHYPLIHWLFTSNCEMGKFDEAVKSLDLIDCAKSHAPQMDYGYERAVKLYKGLVKPEEYINEEEMKKKVLPRPDRVKLEQCGMLYGLYWYWTLRGETEKAKAAIEKLMKQPYPGAFGYTKSVVIAKKLGIPTEEDK